MARFDDCLQTTFTLEGGYANVSGDHGKATEYGVTQITYDRWRKAQELSLQDVKHITYAEAASVFHEYYWLPVKAESLPIPVDLVVFDTAVNSGVMRAVKMLQTIARVPADGINGPKTLSAIAAIDSKMLAHTYLDARKTLYQQIVANDATQAKFLKGWLNRIVFLRNIVG